MESIKSLDDLYNKLEARIKVVEEKIDSVENKLETKIKKVKNKMNTLDGSIRDINFMLKDFDSKINVLDKRIDLDIENQRLTANTNKISKMPPTYLDALSGVAITGASRTINSHYID